MPFKPKQPFHKLPVHPPEVLETRQRIDPHIDPGNEWNSDRANNAEAETDIPLVLSNGGSTTYENEEWTILVPTCDDGVCDSLESMRHVPNQKLKKRVESSHDGSEASPWAALEDPPKDLVEKWLQYKITGRLAAGDHTPHISTTSLHPLNPQGRPNGLLQYGGFKMYQAARFTKDGMTTSVDTTRLFRFIDPRNNLPDVADVRGVIVLKLNQVNLHYIVSPYLVYMTQYYWVNPPNGLQPYGKMYEYKNTAIDVMPTPAPDPERSLAEYPYSRFMQLWNERMKSNGEAMRRVLSDVSRNMYDG
ncbi:MAG: hypothetical protein M1831_007272, partial [Alyxoria varia]